MLWARALDKQTLLRSWGGGDAHGEKSRALCRMRAHGPGGLRVAEEGFFREASLSSRKRKEKLTTGGQAGETLSVRGPSLHAGKFKDLQWGEEGHLSASERAQSWRRRRQ